MSFINDPYIDELRKKKFNEEKLNKERKIIEERQKKKAIEIGKQKRVKGRDTYEILQTYDQKGNFIDVIDFKELPPISHSRPKEKIVEHMQENPSNVSELPKGRNMTKFRGSILFKHISGSQKPTNERKVENTFDIYESFLPANGVTFSELGRTPKFFMKSKGITRNDFNSLIMGKESNNFHKSKNTEQSLFSEKRKFSLL